MKRAKTITTKEREMFWLCGVYQITNLKNGNRYIGSSKNVWVRFVHHKVMLGANKSENLYLQEDFNKMGVGVFSLCVLEKCDLNIRVEREQYWLDKLNPEYNISKCAESNKGVKHRPESCLKMGKRAWTPEQREVVAEARRGKPGNRLGKSASPETVEKMRQANLGKKYSSEINKKKGRSKETHSWWGKGRAIIQFDQSGQEMQEFISADQAALAINKPMGGSNIRKCCDGKIPSSYGFRWKYKNIAA